MSQHLFPKSPAPLRVVDRVEFGVWSPEQIMRYSVVEIKHQETYENRRPKPGGLSDPHMGCVDQDSRCLTCDQTINHCVGHFGHLVLARPVFHIGFLQKVKKILETVCMECARLRIPYSEERGSKYQALRHIPKSKDRFRYAWEHSKNKRSCEHSDCGRQLLPIRKVANRLYTESRKSASGRFHKRLLTAARVRDVLQRISDEDCRALGLDPVRARPEWMVLTVLPVPPPAIRPSVTMDTSGRGEDDLTHKLSDIIKYNNLIRNDDDEDGEDRTLAPSDKEEQLQYHISAYYDNENSGNPVSLQKSGKPTRSFRARLKGKDGRLRGNLQGKRVNHAARTVITGDPNLAIDQVGVPLAIARNLSRPETVCDWNRERLQRLVDRRSEYPGAKYVFTKEGERHDLRYTKEPLQLKNGDVVERHLVDDDRLLFNRQPTLHRPSMMSHRVKVMPFSTFRLNLSVTTPYNADFGKLARPQCSSPAFHPRANRTPLPAAQTEMK
jgi:DNA-directed RNA polymerase II subunit RPB1